MPLSNHRTAPSLLFRVGSMVPYAWIAAIILFAITYAFPQTDDFCTFGRLLRISKGNPFLETWYLYQNWTGRYTSSFLVTLVGWFTAVIPAPIQWVYSASLALIIIMFGWGCFALSRLLSSTRAANLPTAAIIFAATIVLMPSKLESLLWVTGAAIYFAGIACLFFLFHSISTDVYIEEQGNAKPTYSWKSLTLIAACVGFNEFIGLALGGFLVLRVLAFARSGEYLKQNIAYFAVFLGAFAFSVLAPGNFARDAGMTTARHDIGMAIPLALRSFDIFVEMHISPNKPLLGWVVLGSAGVGWLAGRTSKCVRLMQFLPLPFTLIASLPMHFLVYSYLSGEETPGRIVNQAYPMALAGVCLFVSWGAAKLVSCRDSAGTFLAYSVVLLAGLFLLSSAQFKQVATVTRDFGPTWRKQQLERHRLLVAASRNRTTAVLAPFAQEGSTPPLLQGTDMNADTSNWVNRCVADFYGVPEVQVLAPK